MKRSIAFVGIPICVGLSIAAAGQSPTTTPQPAFEVASIKPSKSQGGLIGGSCHGVDSKYSTAESASAPPLGRCVYVRTSLKALIQMAYLETFLEKHTTITGGDSWTGSDEFDVEAKAEDPENTTEAQLQLMLQTLLRNRFKLQFHRETHEQPGFALLRVQNGPKLKDATGNEVQTGLTTRLNGAGRMTTGKVRMPDVARFASNVLGQPVQDKTELAGTYDMSLNWIPGPGEKYFATGSSSTDPAGPSFFTALREQLGLRLESQKVPIEVFVIDQAEKPHEN